MAARIERVFTPVHSWATAVLIILFDSEARDLIYGLHAGYNYDLGNFVVGGQIDYDWTQISDSGSGIDLDNVARMKARLV